ILGTILGLLKGL
uniref:Protonectin n=2 Tax=Epiponini TaxID=76992 RepID=PROTO_AGEPP|nr:RecName: Full=Protonectin; Short=PTN [Protonectarina sylveirae]P69437.1 RecName: Full=Protonectin; Short=PTN; AltName: Full=Agelaia-chemotactic peptide; Short=Agelaia-CP; Contains: RecName: Full=Protonectin (1-6); Short=PNT (1-6) [Agelaia pallipes]prf//1918355A wasp venom peptide [Protonectarina sylveirae]